ncbi:MAG: TIGR04551 family protein [Deltaproteobacteria bacterium]|nr:TIGR04551 family protein [Deltaproteobacteria bacterium]
MKSPSVPFALTILTMLTILGTSARAEESQEEGDDTPTEDRGVDPDPIRSRSGLMSEHPTLAERLERFEVSVHGDVRVRSSVFGNFDLDRGLTPSGRALFSLPLSDPSSQTLTHADMRARIDLTVMEPEGSGAFVRLSLLDGLSLGSAPAGLGIDSSRQLTPADAIQVVHAYARVATPIGLLVAGRTPSHFGLGLAANSGDAEDADFSDSADRVAFNTPIFNHIFTLAYDFGSGPSSQGLSSSQSLDLDSTDDVRTITFATQRVRSERARARRERVGKTTVDYGLGLSHRYQDRAYPVTEAGAGEPRATQAVDRRYRAFAGDLWARVTRRGVRIEAEAVLAVATLDEATLIPGVLLRNPVESLQFGAVLESDFVLDPVTFGLDLGFASGDAAPGFGSRISQTTLPAEVGDLDGGQVSPPDDLRADNFKFHSQYRVDRILFREIIGRVTDAMYARPHAEVELLEVGRGSLRLSLALVASTAVYAESTPSGQKPLGIELDPTLAWINRDGFRLTLEHAVLFPLSGFDNPGAGLDARPAQLVRGRFFYAF